MYKKIRYSNLKRLKYPIKIKNRSSFQKTYRFQKMCHYYEMFHFKHLHYKMFHIRVLRYKMFHDTTYRSNIKITNTTKCFMNYLINWNLEYSFIVLFLHRNNATYTNQQTYYKYSNSKHKQIFKQSYNAAK